MKLLKVHRTLAIGESPGGLYWRKYSGLSPIGEIPGDVLAKVQRTFVNWRNSRGCIGESTVDFRQLAKLHGMYWRNSGTPRLFECGSFTTYSKKKKRNVILPRMSL